MNAATLQRIIGEVISRLEQRAGRTATLSVAQLQEVNARSLACQYASLHIELADLPFLNQFAQQDADDPVTQKIHDALALGMEVRISLHHRLLPSLAVKKLARLPVRLTDEQGQPVGLHPDTLLSYADVARFSGKALLLRRRCIVTALAREAAVTRNIQLIKQE
ncbi:TPA: microcompartment protein PduM [Citrobacter freundii]